MLTKDNKLCTATPESLASITTVRKLATELDRHDIFETKTSLGEETINIELANRMKHIVREELRRRGRREPQLPVRGDRVLARRRLQRSRFQFGIYLLPRGPRAGVLGAAARRAARRSRLVAARKRAPSGARFFCARGSVLRERRSGRYALPRSEPRSTRGPVP